MKLAWGVDPCHQFRHQRRHVSGRRWCVDGLAGRRVDDVVLNDAILPRHRPVTPHAGDQSLVNLANQAFRDRQAAIQIVRHQLEGLAVVQQLPDIVGIGFRHGFAPHQPLGLFESELGPFDVRGVVSFEDQCPLAHGTHPLLGKRGCFKESAGAFNPHQRIGNGVGDRETWLKTLLRHELHPTRQNRNAGTSSRFTAVNQGKDHPEGHLFEVALARGQTCRLSSRLHGRQQEADEHADDRDHRQKLDECKTAADS